MTSGWADWAIDGSDSRSPLVVRLTEMAITAALLAVEGLTSVLMTPAVKTLTTQAVVIFLSLSSKLLHIARLRRHSAVAVSKRNSVQCKQANKHGRQRQTEQFCSHALVHRRVLFSLLTTSTCRNVSLQNSRIQRVVEVSLVVKTSGLPALTTTGASTLVRTPVVSASEIRALIPIVTTKIAAMRETATIFAWVVKSADQSELFMTFLQSDLSRGRVRGRY
jgi:hypothetical protein